MTWYASVFAELEMSEAVEKRWRALEVDPATFRGWPKDFRAPSEPVLISATLDPFVRRRAPTFLRFLRKGSSLTICGTFHEEDWHHRDGLAVALRAAGSVGARGDAYLGDSELGGAWHVVIGAKTHVGPLSVERRDAIYPRFMEAFARAEAELSPARPSREAKAKAKETKSSERTPPPAPVSRNIEALERAYKLAGCQSHGLTPAETDVLLARYWHLAETTTDAAAGRKWRSRASSLVDIALGPGDLAFDHEDVAGTWLCDRAIEVLRAKGDAVGFVARIARIRDKPLSPDAHEKRERGVKTAAALAAFTRGDVSDDDRTLLLEALRLWWWDGFRLRDRPGLDLRQMVTRPDEALARGARERLTDELVEKAADYRIPESTKLGFYGVGLVRVLAANGDFAHLRHVWWAEKTRRRRIASTRIASQCAEMLLGAAPPKLFLAIFGTTFVKYRRDEKSSPGEWYEGMGGATLYAKTDELLEAWRLVP